MTRQDFEFFAAKLEQYPNLLMDYDFIDDLMDWFHYRNPNFDHYRFLIASGFDAEEIKEIWDLDEDS